MPPTLPTSGWLIQFHILEKYTLRIVTPKARNPIFRICIFIIFFLMVRTRDSCSLNKQKKKNRRGERCENKTKQKSNFYFSRVRVAGFFFPNWEEGKKEKRRRQQQQPSPKQL
eukprot:TRINITY_DN33151_c0_g1_i1.p1 TRINITY_DN33151_c0_g1~~TRINITY_DN33151_c0_g1_i1.p1  ORF type:complete len:113 (+),score=1.18 TRINITY_DN33151_c0_g1_i1:123-461(+)